jgi:2-polyprenyl-6-methoxyphenol hydroxylase-like FAD-dependent oxidoreductase
VAALSGGPAGLAVALGFARKGRNVVLIERDGPPRGRDAVGFFERWDRRGIAHFRRPHNFLALARQVLLEYAPDVLETVIGCTRHGLTT